MTTKTQAQFSDCSFGGDTPGCTGTGHHEPPCSRCGWLCARVWQAWMESGPPAPPHPQTKPVRSCRFRHLSPPFFWETTFVGITPRAPPAQAHPAPRPTSSDIHILLLPPPSQSPLPNHRDQSAGVCSSNRHNCQLLCPSHFTESEARRQRIRTGWLGKNARTHTKSFEQTIGRDLYTRAGTAVDQCDKVSAATRTPTNNGPSPPPGRHVSPGRHRSHRPPPRPH